MYQGQVSSEVKLGGKCWLSLFWVSFEKLEVQLEPNLGQDALGVPLYVNEVKGHVHGQVLS